MSNYFNFRYSGTYNVTFKFYPFLFYVLLWNTDEREIFHIVSNWIWSLVHITHFIRIMDVQCMLKDHCTIQVKEFCSDGAEWLLHLIPTPIIWAVCPISGYNRPLATISFIMSILSPVSLYKPAKNSNWNLYKTSNFYFYPKFDINSDCGWNKRRVGHFTLGSTYFSYIITRWLVFINKRACVYCEVSTEAEDLLMI